MPISFSNLMNNLNESSKSETSLIMRSKTYSIYKKLGGKNSKKIFNKAKKELQKMEDDNEEADLNAKARELMKELKL